WLLAPGDDLAAAVAADVDVSVSAGWTLDAVVTAATDAGRIARVHLKADTGLGRAGATAHDWPALVERAAKCQADGLVDVVGIWSHLAYADAPGHPTVARQVAAYAEALDIAGR